MGFTRRGFMSLAGLLWIHFAPAFAAPSTAPRISYFAPEDVITRDVCVIGGGSTGTYAAIRLRDMGKSVVVVEAKNRLGGHAETYTDPATNATIDIGVMVWHDLPVVRNCFARLNVSLTTLSFDSSGPTTYADFSTGEVTANYTPPDPSVALGAYAAQLAKYPYLETGFNLPYPVPADLLLPFGDFLRKYSLDAVARTAFQIGEGYGNILDQPTLYVLKVLGLDTLRSFQTGFLTTADHDNSELYEEAQDVLGADALLSSHVQAMDRGAENGVQIIVATPSDRSSSKLASWSLQFHQN